MKACHGMLDVLGDKKQCIMKMINESLANRIWTYLSQHITYIGE